MGCENKMSTYSRGNNSYLLVVKNSEIMLHFKF